MKRYPAAWTACLATVAVLLIHLGAGDAAAQKKKGDQFEDSTSVVLVEVPVTVLKNGEPVRGLTADNFEVFEGRKSLPVVGFDMVDLSLDAETPVTMATVPAAGRRHFLMLFDLSFSDPAAVVKARNAARELVLNGLHQTDVVAVGTYSKTGGARLLLTFTPDRSQIEYALQTLGMVQPNQGVRDPLGIVLAELGDSGASGGGPAGGAAEAAGLDPAAEILELLSGMERTTRRQVQQNEILAMSGSLAELAKMMNAVQGRKHVVFLSEGFDSQVLLGTTDQARSTEINEAAMSGELWNVNSDERFGNTATTGELMEMLGEFTKADCTIQAVDIGGLAADGDVSPRASGQDGLFIMANETGGEFYRNYNDLSDAMSDMLERNSVTYVLAVQPDSLKMDGKYHRLKVKLKGGPSGADLVHRPGYYAPKPFSEQTAMERSLAAADMVVSGTDGGRIGLSVLATPFEVNQAPAWVPVLIEVDGSSLAENFKDDILPVELYAYALDASGRVRDFFVKTFPFDMKKAGDQLRQSGFKYWGEFELPAGEYIARVVIRNSKTGSSAIRTSAFKVPEMSTGESALLPPLFPEPAGKWLLAREENSVAQEYGYDYPFMRLGEAYIPAARPLVSAAGDTAVSLVGYNLASGSLHIAGELFGLDGTLAEGVELLVDERRDTGDPAIEQIAGRLRTGGLVAGEYRLVVTVTDPSTGKSETSEIPVVVGG